MIPEAAARRAGGTAPTSLASRRRPWARVPRPARRDEAAALKALAEAAIRRIQPRFGAVSPLEGIDFARLIAERAVHVLDDDAEEASPSAMAAATDRAPDYQASGRGEGRQGASRQGTAGRGGAQATGGTARRPAAVMVALPTDRVLTIPLIAVRPDRRGQGLARALIAYAETLARVSGLGRVELTVEDVLWEQKARYARLGYQPVDRREDRDGLIRAIYRKDIG